MKVTVNEITGFADAFVAMYISKRSWTPELDKEIRDVCKVPYEAMSQEEMEKFNKWLNLLCKITKKHITLGRFIDISLMTQGLHRGGCDDVDSHAMRFDNRIIRSSTRLSTFGQDEFSTYYDDKVMTTDKALKELGIEIPDSFETNDSKWVKSPNGYIKAEYENNKDVMRGLYMLGIPSNFVAKINLTEWSHVYKQRGKHGGANPEVKEWAESIADQLEKKYPQLNRELFMAIEN